MIIILPIGHDELTLSRLPFATFALMGISIVASLVGSTAVTDAVETEAQALVKVHGYYQGHDYLELSPEALAASPQHVRVLHQQRREWLEWLAAAPDEAAELVESILVEKHKQGVVSMLDATGEVVQVSQDDGSPRSLGEVELTAIKAEFLGRAAQIEPERKHEEQQRLDELTEKYSAAVRDSLARRLAYVPASPSPIGLVTHIFIHGGVWHLVFNLIFLWIVATKLEDIWGRPLFVSAFAIFGVLGALTHGLADPDSTAPLIGASGSVAGLMGAYVVRLARIKIKFIYFYMILRPRYGSFDAPAFLIFPLWFFGELVYALFLDFGGIAYWAHVGGFIAGLALAAIFKLTDFERRVLGREPEAQVDPDTLPLVAFQRPTAGDASRADVDSRVLALREAELLELGPERARGAVAGGADLVLARGDVSLVAAAQVIRVSGPLAGQWFAASRAPAEPAVLLVLLVPGKADEPAGPTSGYVFDAAKLRYNRLFEQPLATPKDNFFALLKKVIALFPAARFAGDRERLAAGELPAHADLEQLASRLLQAKRAST